MRVSCDMEIERKADNQNGCIMYKGCVIGIFDGDGLDSWRTEGLPDDLTEDEIDTIVQKLYDTYREPHDRG